jgi:Kelch motif
MAVIGRVKGARSRNEVNYQAYCVGGYSIKEGALAHVERFSLDTKEWSEIAPMSIKRISPGACSIGETHIYVFGGRSEGDEFFDSIERYNVELDLWNMLTVKLPRKLCNLFAFSFTANSQDNILVMGGLKKSHENEHYAGLRKKVRSGNVESEPDRNVYMYNRQKEVWYQLKPIPNKLKVVNVVHSGTARFHLFMLDPSRKQDLPKVTIYDLREMCPRLDRYWYHLHLEEREEARRMEHRGLEFYARESSTAEPGRSKLVNPSKPQVDVFERVLQEKERDIKIKEAKLALEVKLSPSKSADNPSMPTKQTPLFERLKTKIQRQLETSASQNSPEALIRNLVIDSGEGNINVSTLPKILEL